MRGQRAWPGGGTWTGYGAGSATTERLLSRLPESCQYGAGLFGVLASLAAWSSGGDWLDALIRQLDHPGPSSGGCWAGGGPPPAHLR
jgi:cystathionine beta-lyase